MGKSVNFERFVVRSSQMGYNYAGKTLKNNTLGARGGMNSLARR